MHYWLWSEVVDYIENRVPFGTHLRVVHIVIASERSRGRGMEGRVV
jgi:hypothetical protein